MAQGDSELYQRLQDHEAHEVEIARYGTRPTGEPVNLTLECLDCGTVIFDTDLYDLAGKPGEEEQTDE